MADVETAVKKRMSVINGKENIIKTTYKYVSAYHLVKAIYFYSHKYAKATIHFYDSRKIQEIKMQARALLHALLFYYQEPWNELKLNLFYKLAMILDLS